MKKIKVSIIVPVYNVEAYLEDCLKSAIEQTLKEIEIICVDDASTDGSLDIIKRYSKKYNNVKIVHQPHNMGLAATRNAGCQSACGEYIYFLDSDDLIEPDTLASLYERAKKERLDVLFFDTDVFGNGVEKKQIESYKRYYQRTHEYNGVYEGSALFASMHKQSEYLCSACLYMTRHRFITDNKLSFCEGMIHEDELYTFQLLMKAKRCGYIQKKYYHRRLRSGSIMTKNKTFDNVKGLLLAAWKGAESLTGIYEEEEKREINLHIMNLSRHALQIYRDLDNTQQLRIKELPFPAQLRLKELLISAEGKKCISASDGMLVYGAGAHLFDMLQWHPELTQKIVRIFDKNPEKIGIKAEGLNLAIESPEQLRELPAGTHVAIAAIRYYDEIVKELHAINPGLICPDIDEAYRLMKQSLSEKENKTNDIKVKTVVKYCLTDLQRMRLKGMNAQERWRINLLIEGSRRKHIFWGVSGVRATYLRKLFIPMMGAGDFFIDEKASMYGQAIDGIPVCRPETLKNVKGKYLIVVLSEDYERVRMRLIDYGYVENVDFVEGRRLLGEDETGYINIPCLDKSLNGMIVYGAGAHLNDMLKWHPELAVHIKTIIDKDKNKTGFSVPNCNVPVEYYSVLRKLPTGTEIAVAAIRYFDEIVKEISYIHPGLICRNIDEIWKEYV